MKKRILFAVVVLFLGACGKKGPLIPPDALVPAPVTNLRTAQTGSEFRVCWSSPGREESGKALRTAPDFLLFKRAVLPPDQDCEECQNSYRLIRIVDPEYLQEIRRINNTFCYFDKDLVQGKTYQYKVVSRVDDRLESKDSNKARRKFLAPPAGTTLKGTPSPTGILLEWTTVGSSDGARIEGYNIYRRKEGGAPPLSPLNPKPVTGNRYEDLTAVRGDRYVYAVRTVATVDGETVESGLSNEVTGYLTEPE
jgi:predicted small lipoprotein YifL